MIDCFLNNKISSDVKEIIEAKQLALNIIEEKLSNHISLEKLSKKFKIGRNKISKFLKYIKKENAKDAIMSFIPKQKKIKGDLKLLAQVMENRMINQD